ncbi:LANO_0B06392g1_1 [Lachancea nothofagi CBS 11611]|uniref:LANO_0B06392g1_1 n=1 Tax=Lachancea nothofagi CBS 11611 TaxID=1266666 RepID=A0A1G4IZB5_9SACH|nr:LANO_0B06392g1_1 [Lachancea nothofagi CBS 11611]
MSTTQQTKPKTVTNTTTGITCEQSQKLVQTMLTMSFGCLSFLRGLFPDDNFVDQRFVPEKVSKDYNKDTNGAQSNSIKIKTLVRGKSPEADLFLDWLEKGVFQSIKLKYLKALSLGVFTNENTPTDLLEDYVFGFNYNNQGEVSISVNGEKEAVSLLDSRKDVQQLMRRFIIITQSLEPLPEKRYLSMRLLFNDSAPPEYQPLLFKDVSHDRPATVKVPESTDLETYSVGSLDTKFHNVALKVLSVVETTDIKEGPTRDIDPFSLIDGSEKSSETIITQETQETQKNVTSQTTNYLQNILSSPTNSFTQTQHLEKSSAYDCQCLTPCPPSTSKVINCSGCRRRLHKICYGNHSHSNLSRCVSCLTNDTDIDYSSTSFQVLMMLRRIFRFMIKKPEVPTKLSGLYEILVGPQADSKTVDNINLALTIMFTDGTIVLEKERRTQSNRSQFLRSSNYIDIDHSGVIVKGFGELSVNTRAVWTFVLNSFNAQIGYTSVTFETRQALEDALMQVEKSISKVFEVEPNSPSETVIEKSPGSSLNFYSLCIDEDTSNTLELGKRKHPNLRDYLDDDNDSHLEDTLKVQSLKPKKIRKISASKKTLRSNW